MPGSVETIVRVAGRRPEGAARSVEGPPANGHLEIVVRTRDRAALEVNCPAAE